jgi:CRISPR-associated endonuclease/helicase Cas3
MFSITLEPHYEKVWSGRDSLLDPFLEKHPLLYHQWRTYNAEKSLIVNTYNTGTGKTKAALLRLLKIAHTIGFHRIDSTEHNALLIAPTNELLAQHARDAQEFCTTCKLPYRVVSISRADLDRYQLQEHYEVDVRRGAALHHLLQNARRVDHSDGKKATLFVVNPDIFYYAFYFCYNRFDRIPLFQDILTLFNYIIIDEFHYYNPKQFANFLFFMRLSKHYGFTERQFCLLTATPGEVVKEYLERLDLPIEWIKPEDEQERPPSHAEETCALAPVTLSLYSEQEMQDGLLTLVREKKADIANALHDSDEDGACISSALWRINQIHAQLRNTISPDLMGRLTGAESREGRMDAKGKRLILATPTVDIGYNFDRSGKKRQNIDFLLFDARSSDECIQRLGRAGRVLGKKFYTIPSKVYAVINQELYEALRQFAGQTLKRSSLRQFVEKHMPARHGLYSYIQSGAIAEAIFPISHLERMASTADKPDIKDLFEEVRNLFAPESTVGYDVLLRCSRRFAYQKQLYGSLEQVPAEMRDCLKACEKRLVAEQTKRQETKRKLWVDAFEAYAWLQEDLRDYFTEKARFSFRESFQSPLALVSDTHHFFSGEPACVYDALHIAKNYRVKYFETLHQWHQPTKSPLPDKADEALVFCDLIELREPDERLHLGFKLIAHNYKKADWEELFVYRSAAYKPTALYGLEVIALNSSRAVDETIKNMLRDRYVPALVAVEGGRTAAEMWRLQRLGQIFLTELHVTFGDLKTAKYYVVLGTMALLVWAEILPYYRKMDLHKSQKDDDAPIIC